MGLARAGYWVHAWVFVVILDIAVAVSLYLAVHGVRSVTIAPHRKPSLIFVLCCALRLLQWSIESLAPAAFWKTLWGFRTDTSDVFLLSLSRLIGSVVLCIAGIRFGTPEQVQPVALRRPAVGSSLPPPGSRTPMRNVASPRVAGHTAGPAFDYQALHVGEEAEAAQALTPNEMFAALDTSEQNLQLQLIARARFRRRVCTAVLFAWQQGHSFYAGVKLVDFEFRGPASMVLQAVLLVAIDGFRWRCCFLAVMAVVVMVLRVSLMCGGWWWWFLAVMAAVVVMMLRLSVDLFRAS